MSVLQWLRNMTIGSGWVTWIPIPHTNKRAGARDVLLGRSVREGDLWQQAKADKQTSQEESFGQ